MQFPPDAADLLTAIRRLLDEQVLPAVPAELAHQVRVAANLTAIVERELRLGPGAAAAERRLLAELLGADVTEVEHVDAATALAERLRGGDDDLERRAWPVLVEITRAELAIAKPGYDQWEGE